MGTGAATHEDCAREQVASWCTESAEAGADAHDADIPGTVRLFPRDLQTFMRREERYRVEDEREQKET